MPLAPGRYSIGPDAGHVHVRTTREGVVARAGHDLLIAFARWTGTITIDRDGTGAVEAEVETASFEVVAGSGGVVPLTAVDKSVITTTARRLLDVDRHARATFAATRIVQRDGGHIDGTLTLRGRSAPLTIEVAEAGPTEWRGTATVLQSAFGITPYRGLFGALRVADPVGVEIAVDLSLT
jgi:polyisoprenoid-binding protein YceI